MRAQFDTEKLSDRAKSGCIYESPATKISARDTDDYDLLTDTFVVSGAAASSMVHGCLKEGRRGSLLGGGKTKLAGLEEGEGVPQGEGMGTLT